MTEKALDPKRLERLRNSMTPEQYAGMMENETWRARAEKAESERDTLARTVEGMREREAEALRRTKVILGFLESNYDDKDAPQMLVTVKGWAGELKVILTPPPTETSRARRDYQEAAVRLANCFPARGPLELAEATKAFIEAKSALANLQKSEGANKARRNEGPLPFLSETMRIIAGGVAGDKKKVVAYAEFMADKMDAAGFKAQAERVRKLARGENKTISIQANLQKSEARSAYQEAKGEKE